MDINYTVFIPQENFTANAVMYKYREVNHYSLCSLILNQVYFSKPVNFNDPFELVIGLDDTDFSQTVLMRELREAGILCLCRSPKNLAMWSYYGSGLRGFTVGYDLKRLLETMEPVSPNNDECTPRWRFVYDVHYLGARAAPVNVPVLIDGDLDSKSKEWRRMFATKSIAFEHEDECRIVVPPSADTVLPYAWSGHGLYQHHADALREIVFGELLPEHDELAIRSILAGRNVSFRRAKRNPLKFEIKIIDEC
ncbi:DUF2971 domain-containing protein [Duganella fentianensis]|uniref:DUF2971 domain-containing protein n=1 Tax=Duganella fentianensis TaxID=2692177 RepID=UPI0032B1A3F5